MQRCPPIKAPTPANRLREARSARAVEAVCLCYLEKSSYRLWRSGGLLASHNSGKYATWENKMRTHKSKVTIPADHQLAVRVPDDFPTGPAEVIIQADSSAEQQIVKLAGVLAPQAPPPPHVDPIADALQEFRHERQQRFEKLEMDTEVPKDS